ncbi:MAG: hypothetical protein MJ213_02395 [Bacilli bacterium]|nr:hypothetical protein [Bacilli bacterium]
MESKQDCPYKNISAPRFYNRFLSVVIDAAIVAVTTLVFSFLTVFIFNKSSYYASSSIYMKDEARVCYRLNEESHLFTYNGEGEGDDHYASYIKQDEIFKKNLYSHILLSFNKDNTYFIERGITSLSIDPSIQPADYATDEITYFYYSFVKDKNEEYGIVDLSSKSFQQYHFDLFKQFEPKINDVSFWELNKVGDFPVLKGEFAYKAYMYLVSDSKSEFTPTYQQLNTQYVNMWNAEHDVLTNSSTYKLHYDNYQNKYRENAAWVDLFLFFVFFLSFLAGYFLPTMFTRLHRSYGKRAERIFVVSYSDKKATKAQIALRALLKIFPYFGFSFVGYMFLSLFNPCWTYPLFYL